MAPPVADSQPTDSIDSALLPLLKAAACAAATRSRIPVLSLWDRIPFVPLLASHLHLRWPGEVQSLPLSPRIGIFPFFSPDMEMLSRPLYAAGEAQVARRAARAARAHCLSNHWRTKSDLYPDWEQALDNRRSKLGPLVLPASSFISVDRVTESGEVRPGHRKIVGRFAPRGEPKPQFLVPARGNVTRKLVRAFDDLDLVLVNAQNARGRHLAGSIEYFLKEISDQVPMVIIASSPADLIFTRALEPPSKTPVVIYRASGPPNVEVKAVNDDRPIAERQFCFAIEGLSERSEILSRLVSQSERTWWATRQAMSPEPPREAQAFESLYADMLTRAPDGELELLEEAKRLILREAGNAGARAERREAMVNAVIHDTRSRSLLVVVRSDAVAQDMRVALAASLDVTTNELCDLGIDVASVFGPWPTLPYDGCVSAGYFGTGTVDMIFAAGAKEAVLIVDPIEARVAVWDIERRFCTIPDLPPSIASALHALSKKLESCAAPSTDPISLSTLFSSDAGARHGATSVAAHGAKPSYVCLCFTDGTTEQVTANAHFEVSGRKRLQLQTVMAKDLQVGDQVIRINDEERAAFSDRLLRVMDEGRWRAEREKRELWLTTLRAVRTLNPVPVAEINRRLKSDRITVDPTTIRSWLPRRSSDQCGVPDRDKVFFAFARAVGVSMPETILADWFAGIDRLRKNHRRIGRDLVKAIRGAHFGRLDPITVARMEREWGLEAKALLEAVRVGTVDDVIALA